MSELNRCTSTVPAHATYRDRRRRLGLGCILTGALAICICVSHSVGFAQEIEVVEPPLIDQQPFDLITLTPEAGGASVKVAPIDFPNRQVPSNPKPTDKLQVVLLKYGDRLYEIAWRDIARDGVKLYEQLVYDEAVAKMSAQDFITAFQNLSFLLKNYPDMPRLESLRQNFILQSAAERYKKGELRQTLSALEELKQTAPGFRSSDVTNILSRVADSLITEYQQNGQLGSAQKLLDRLTEAYGPTLPVVELWGKRLKQMALAKKEEAASLMKDKKFREARAAAIEMLSIFPDLEEGQEFIAEINRVHPMVRVGVMQRSGELNPSSLIDWPARRAGGLVYKSLFQFLETGAEGGKYSFSLGQSVFSDDRQQLSLMLDPDIQDSLTSFGLAQELLERAVPGEPAYDPSWAAIFGSVAAKSAGRVEIALKRPNVLPHALLQWTLPDNDDQPGSLPGDYKLSFSDGRESSFVQRTPGQFDGQPVEIIEIFYEDPKLAVNDLLRGELDVIDQLYPADARKLASNPDLSVGSYALPTTHMLIPVSEHEYLALDKFRRALLYATNRYAMLTGELLGSENSRDGQLVSGPFPIGDGESDPLAYAYNPDILPLKYNPKLARLLLVMSTQELSTMAEKKEEPAPELEPLVVGCPDFELARVAVQAMIQQWSSVGIKAEMKILPAGRIPDDHGCDLLYVVTTMWEPATDVERLLGGNGIAATNNPFIIQGLERLRNSRNWREVRGAMQDLHQLIHYHLPVLPLWQITDRFVASRYVDGLKDRPVSLYQNIDDWRLNLGFKTNLR